MNSETLVIRRFFNKTHLSKFNFRIIPLLLVLSGCASTPEQIPVNDFSTQTRVEYVLECMNQRGGQSYQHFYPCVCSVDKIATMLSNAEYTQAQTYARFRSLPGERGSVFRDPPKARNLRKRLTEAKSLAAKVCNLK